MGISKRGSAEGIGYKQLSSIFLTCTAGVINFGSFYLPPVE